MSETPGAVIEGTRPMTTTDIQAPTPEGPVMPTPPVVDTSATPEATPPETPVTPAATPESTQLGNTSFHANPDGGIGGTPRALNEAQKAANAQKPEHASMIDALKSLWPFGKKGGAEATSTPSPAQPSTVIPEAQVPPPVPGQGPVSS